jgi:Sel1 repeat
VKKQVMIGGLILAVQILGAAGAVAGPWEDGMAAYNRGDYVPAIRLFRPLAEQGNAKAQNVLGVMYRRGQGVARNSVRAFVWFSRAAARGDATAKAELHEVSQTMTVRSLRRRARWRRPARLRITAVASIDAGRHSGARVERASPESITTIGSRDSGPAPSGASTMCNCTSGNDE